MLLQRILVFNHAAQVEEGAYLSMMNKRATTSQAHYEKPWDLTCTLNTQITQK